jgi:hypothetical protein
MHIQAIYEPLRMWRRLIALTVVGIALLGACATSAEQVTPPERLIGLSVSQAKKERPGDEAFITYDYSSAILNKEPVHGEDPSDDFVVLAACQEEGGFAVVAVPEVDGRPLVEEAKKGAYQEYLRCVSDAG